MNAQYIETVRRLLAVAPAVFEPGRFALKGGTALNLFVQDMPRLSVDLDLVFTDHTLARAAALDAIASDLRRAKSRLAVLGYGALLPATRGGEELKLLIEPRSTALKVEVNGILRGTLLPAKQCPLVARAQELFTTDVQLPVLDPAELYGGKLVAALDRQHPRDLFDVSHMLERFGWRPDILDCFVAYLAAHNRPVHEVLFAGPKPLEPAFSGEFAGMTAEPVELSILQRTQERLLAELPRQLTAAQREFLLSVVRGQPDWLRLPFAHLREMPGIQWKLLNLRKLKSRAPDRFNAQAEELAARFVRL